MSRLGETLRVDSQRTRNQILHSARELFDEVGYEHARMADVARHVGCSRATVYNHFASRDDLLTALCIEYLDGYLDIGDRVAAWVQPHHSIFDVLHETVALELRWRASHGDLRGILDSAKLQRIDFYVEGNERIDQAMLAWFGAIYATSAELGLIRRDVDLSFATRVIYTMFDHILADFDVTTPEDKLTQAAEQIARLQWHALYVGEPEISPLYSSLRLPSAASR